MKKLTGTNFLSTGKKSEPRAEPSEELLEKGRIRRRLEELDDLALTDAEVAEIWNET